MATHLYFDHPQEHDPEERGLHWATRYTDAKKTFGFIPDDIFANADVSIYGIPYNLSELCYNEPCPRTKRPENVIGELRRASFISKIADEVQTVSH